MKIVILIAKGKRDKKRGLSQFFVYLRRAIKHETLVKNGIRAEKRLVEGRVQQWLESVRAACVIMHE